MQDQGRGLKGDITAFRQRRDATSCFLVNDAGEPDLWFRRRRSEGSRAKLGTTMSFPITCVSSHCLLTPSSQLTQEDCRGNCQLSSSSPLFSHTDLVTVTKLGVAVAVPKLHSSEAMELQSVIIVSASRAPPWLWIVTGTDGTDVEIETFAPDPFKCLSALFTS